MDPITLIVAALSAAAVAAAKEGATDAVKSTYHALKSAVESRFATVSVKPLEQRPGDKDRQRLLAEDLQNAGADGDEDLVKQAAAMLDIVRVADPEAVLVVGVDLRNAEGKTLDLKDIEANGFGAVAVRASNVKIHGAIKMRGIRATDDSQKKT